jgi:nucleotide-binding universal stress UspA family protein
MSILVAAANDAVRDRVVQVAVELGQALGEELHVVHFVDDTVDEAAAADVGDELRERLLGEEIVATVTVERLDRSLARPNARIGTELVELAAATGVSHIVVGHSSKEFVENLAKGNTAFTVADAAQVPVTIVPDGSEDRGGA